MIANFILVLCGVFTVFCAYKDFDWFMDNYKASPLVKLLGRNGARIFYMVIGVLFIVGGFLIKV